MTGQVRFWLATFVALSAAFVVSSEEVVVGAARVLDLEVHAAFGAIWRNSLHPLFQAVAELGGLEVTFALGAGLAAYLIWRRFRVEAWAVMALPLAVLVEGAYKRFLIHPRPPPLHADGPSLNSLILGHLFHGGALVENSYPSGHMVRTVVVYGLIAFIVSRLARTRWARRAAVALAAVIIAAMAFDRLYLAVHWASDVAGGLLLGGLALAAAILWLDRPWTSG
jgi:membrane-associated phospholipid phosphatase